MAFNCWSPPEIAEVGELPKKIPDEGLGTDPSCICPDGVREWVRDREGLDKVSDAG